MLGRNKDTKTKSKPKATCKFKNRSHVCVISLCTTVVHNSAQMSSDYTPKTPVTLVPE